MAADTHGPAAIRRSHIHLHAARRPEVSGHPEVSRRREVSGRREVSRRPEVSGRRADSRADGAQRLPIVRRRIAAAMFPSAVTTAARGSSDAAELHESFRSAVATTCS